MSSEKFPRGMRATTVAIEHSNWIGEISEGACEARYRYRQALMSATLSKNAKEIVLEEPHYVPQGQSLVLYRGEQCLGGGIITGATLST